MVMTRALDKGRQALARREWQVAFDQLALADHEAALDAADLEQLGNAAYLVGNDDEAIAAWTRAHHAFVDQDEPLRAARMGFWLSLCLMLGGNAAQCGGWLSRSQRLIDEQQGECAEQGLLLVICGLISLFKGDGAKACLQFEQAASLGRRFADADLRAASVLGQGQALMHLQRTDEGVALLDESMIAVTSGQVTPIMAGIIYCAVILACEGICDFQRAQEWTVALDKWCGAQPGLVAFRGQCLVHRSELLRFKGDWAAALDAASRAREFLAGRSERLLGRAIYQEAELHRLAGHLVRAEEAYREAGTKGFEPQPGISLLRLAQGEAKAAAASIRRVASEAGRQQGPGAGVQRVRVLGPYVEIMLAVDELGPARTAVAELERTAARMKAPLLTAIAAHEKGAVLLADGQPGPALTVLREAWTLWQQLEVPFESARARVLIARACWQLGDEVTAKLHLDAAASIFERLGAASEMAALQAGAAARDGPAAVLSGRERQVLALLASGKTNRQIAAELGISEHTVARHVSNIFDKIGVASRTAASAFAFANHLV
jgi:DNA-binding CsgD family transcriptional regulator